MAEAVSTFIRYDSVDQDGQTRRQRNIRFGAEHENKDVKVPELCWYLWEWFFEISGTRRSRTERISYSDLKAWSDLSGNDINSFEFECLTAMDRAFVDAMSVEIAANQERERIRNEARSKVKK